MFLTEIRVVADEGEPMANENNDDTWEKEGAKREREVMMAETTGEIEIEM